MESRANRWLLLMILLAGLGARLGWTLSRPTDPATIEILPDQREYVDLAHNLRSGDGLSFADPRFNTRVYAYRTPGYPAFLAAVGVHLRAARLAQAALDTSTIVAAYVLARRWLTSRRALFAAAVVAFNPYLIYFSGLLLTETLFTAMLAGGMALMTHPRTLAWLAGGSVLAMSVLVRPGAIALPLLLGLSAALLNRNGATAYQRRWPLPAGTTMLLLTLATLFPWAYRNHRVLGEWIWTSTNGGITAYDGFNPDATGASDQRFVQAMPQLRTMSETQRDEYLGRKAKECIRDNPLRAMQLALVKVGRTWSPMPLSKEFSNPLYIAAALAYSVPLYLLIVAGLSSSTLPWSAKVFLSAPALYLTLAAALSVGSLRYRIPAEVPMAVIAAAAIPGRLGRSGRAQDPPV